MNSWTSRILCTAVLATLGLAGCKADPIVLPASPRIVELKASPSVLEHAGEVTLSWTVEGADRVELSGSNRGLLTGDLSAGNGTAKVAVERDELFVLRAVNAQGVSSSEAVAVRLETLPQDLLLSVSPPGIRAGEEVNVAWSVPAGKTAQLLANGEAVDLGGRNIGTLALRPMASTTYELSADGKKVTSAVVVSPNVVSFEANPATVLPGEQLKLRWSALGAVKGALYSDEQGKLHDLGADELASGEFTVQVPTSLDPGLRLGYRLELDGGEGSTQAVARVLVQQRSTPKVTRFDVPEYGKAGTSITLRWSAVDSDRLTLFSEGVAIYETQDSAEILNGSMTLTAPAAIHSYAVEASHQTGGHDRVEKVFTPMGPLGTLALTSDAPTGGVANAGDVVTLTWSAPNALRVVIREQGGPAVTVKKGVASAQGTVTVLPSRTTRYELTADNSVGDVKQVTTLVQVQNPLQLTPAVPGPFVAGAPVAFSFNMPGATVEGLPHDQVDFTANSLGFVDIRATGNALSTFQSGEWWKLVKPDFETQLFGIRMGEDLAISPVGNLLFSPTAVFTGSVVNRSLTASTEKNDQFLLAPFWDDLVLIGNSEVHWEVRGQAPERTLYVQWTNATVRSEPTSQLTFQAQITESGVIRYVYRNLKVSADKHKEVIGVQGPRYDLVVNKTFPVNTALPTDFTLTFFGPRTSPVPVLVKSSLRYRGLIRQTNGAMPVSFEVPVLRSGDVVVSEVMYRAPASVTAGDWIELQNNTDQFIDLAGWELVFPGNLVEPLPTAPGTLVLPPFGTRVVGQSTVRADNGNAPVDYAWAAGRDLSDVASTLTLRRTSGGYSTSVTWAAGAVPEGTSAVFDRGGFKVQADPNLNAQFLPLQPYAMNCAGTGTYGSLTGNPGRRGGCFPYAVGSAPSRYVDVNQTGTPLFNQSSDTDLATVDLSLFPVRYLGTDRTQLTVSPNGWLSFFPVQCTGPLTTCTNGSPTYPLTPTGKIPRGAIAPLWRDLTVMKKNNVDSLRGSNVFVQHFAADEDLQARAPHWIVSWHRMNGFGEEVSFQAWLFDSGLIEYHYGRYGAGGSGSTKIFGMSSQTWLDAEDNTRQLCLVSGLNGSTPIATLLSSGAHPFTSFRLIPENFTP